MVRRVAFALAPLVVLAACGSGPPPAAAPAITPGGAPALTTYLGTAMPGPTAGVLVIEVATATAKLALRCTPAPRPIGATCKERKPAAIAVLDCFVPGFEQPMTSAPAPGVVFDGGCGAYRRLP